MRASWFWNWWIQELYGLVPIQFRPRPVERSQIVITFDDDQVKLSLFSGDRELASSTTAARQSDVEDALLKLQASADRRPLVFVSCGEQSVFFADHDYPKAAARTLDRLARFEAIRTMPFSTDDVYHASSIISRDNQSTSIGVRFYFVKKKVIDSVLASVQALNIGVDGAVSPNKLGQARFDLGKHPLLAKRRFLVSRQTALALGLVAGVAACLGGLLHRQSIVLDRLEATLQKVRIEAADASNTRNQASQLKQQLQELRTAKHSATSPLLLIETLSRALPDTVWLDTLYTDDDAIVMTGRASSAAPLIAELSGSPVFENVALTSPIRSDRRAGNEQFSIRFEFKPVEERLISQGSVDKL
ncbi:MAG: PilN domain-containing protein [Pseudomonadota bacterium]